MLEVGRHEYRVGNEWKISNKQIKCGSTEYAPTKERRAERKAASGQVR